MARRKIYSDVCSVRGCGRATLAHGLCSTHGMRRLTGRPLEGPIQEQRKYTDEDVQVAREMAAEIGVEATARDLGIPRGTVGRWVRMGGRREASTQPRVAELPPWLSRRDAAEKMRPHLTQVDDHVVWASPTNTVTWTRGEELWSTSAARLWLLVGGVALTESDIVRPTCEVRGCLSHWVLTLDSTGRCEAGNDVEGRERAGATLTRWAQQRPEKRRVS